MLFTLTIGLTSMAQTTAMTSATYGAVLDTVTNSTAHYLVTGRVSGVATTVAIHFTALEISGTTAGTATLEASIDGTTWYPYYDSRDSTYSFTLTDVATAQNYRWLVFTGGDEYYRVKVVGSGTVSVKISAKYKSKKG